MGCGDRRSSTVCGLVGRPGTQAKGRGSHRFPEELANPRLLGRPGRRELASSSEKESRACLALDRPGQFAPGAVSFPRKQKRSFQGILQELCGGRLSEALGPCILGAEARRSVQSRRAGKTRRCDFARCCHKKKTQSRRRYCAWQTCCQLPGAEKHPAIQRHARRTHCDVDSEEIQN